MTLGPHARDLAPTIVASHPHLRAFTGELHEADKMAQAMREAKPNVVYIMLASEAAPYTAVSTGTHSALLALRELTADAAREPRATPFISIAAWGLGPMEAHITGFFARMFVDVAKALFWSKPFTDFKKQLAEVEEAKGKGLIRPTLVLPPMLNKGEKTDTYLSDEASTMKAVMGVTRSELRAARSSRCEESVRW